MNVQLWGAAAVIVLGYVVGFYFQHRELDKLEGNLNRRIDDLRSEMNHRFDDLKDWIRSEIRRMDERIERLEHPAVRGGG